MIRALALLTLFWVHMAIGANNNQFFDFFNTLTSLKADFIQTTYDDKDALINTTSGSFIFNRPKQLRWHTTTPNEEILLLNNNELWLVDIELEQASLQKSQDLSQTPLYWLINKPNTIKNIPIFSHQQDGIDWYKANSQSSQYQQLLFGFKDKVLHAISFKNPLDQTIKIIFEKALINPAIKPKDFDLKLGSEFDVIR
jgi:outer membrane lipoprotein carrier protein